MLIVCYFTNYSSIICESVQLQEGVIGMTFKIGIKQCICMFVYTEFVDYLRVHCELRDRVIMSCHRYQLG